MRIHVTTQGGEEIFGSLNIGKLVPTNIVRIDRTPGFLNEKNQLVFCTLSMRERIEERLRILSNNN